MGVLLTKAIQTFSTKNEQILLLGMGYAGKTTILNHLTNKEIKYAVPTIGFITKEITYKNLKIVSWDILKAIQQNRYIWRNHYFPETKGLIYVIDCSDELQFNDTKDTLHYIISTEEMKGKPVLVLANKSDVGIMTLESIAESLNLDKLEGIGKWNIQRCCAEKGDGIQDAIDWIQNALDEENQKGK